VNFYSHEIIEPQQSFDIPELLLYLSKLRTHMACMAPVPQD